jgi:hypothetical protein
MDTVSYGIVLLLLVSYDQTNMQGYIHAFAHPLHCLFVLVFFHEECVWVLFYFFHRMFYIQMHV